MYSASAATPSRPPQSNRIRRTDGRGTDMIVACDSRRWPELASDGERFLRLVGLTGLGEGPRDPQPRECVSPVDSGRILVIDTRSWIGQIERLVHRVVPRDEIAQRRWCDVGRWDLRED